MRNNRRKVDLKLEKENKKIIYILITIIILAVIAFSISCIIYTNYLNNKSNLNLAKISEYSKVGGEETSQTSLNLGKSVNEIENENIDTTKTNKINNDENNNEEKIAINTSNIIRKTNQENDSNEEIEKIESNNLQNKDILSVSFIKPVEGEIIKDFAKNNLIYSETLKEWTTHNGIDIKANEKSVVKASCDGIIKSINNDPKLGISITIEHENGYETIYANLMTAEFVKEGETIKQGQTIGTVGKTASFEIEDESHLHFELLKNGEYLDPSEYIK